MRERNNPITAEIPKRFAFDRVPCMLGAVPKLASYDLI